MDRKNWQ